MNGYAPVVPADLAARGADPALAFRIAEIQGGFHGVDAPVQQADVLWENGDGDHRGSLQRDRRCGADEPQQVLVLLHADGVRGGCALAVTLVLLKQMQWPLLALLMGKERLRLRMATDFRLIPHAGIAYR